MAGFSSLNTALTAMRYQQIALDIASTNVANADTDGYVRRRVVGETVGAGAVAALWSRSTQVGAGVRASAVDRMVNPYLDIRGRAEHAKQSYLDLQAESLARVETGLAEPGDNGVATAISKFRSTLHDLVSHPGDDAARSQVLAAAGSVADAIRLQARNVTDEMGDQQARLQATVAEVNTTAAQLAATNHSIAASLGAGDTASLLDERDRLAMKLAELTGATAEVQADGTMNVTLGTSSLVAGETSGVLTASGSPTAFAVDGTALSGPPGGQVGASADLVDTKLPAYLAGLSAVAKTFADGLNTQHAAGYDSTGALGGPLFSYDPADVAGTIAVAITDTSKLAAYSVPPATGLDAGNAGAMIGAITIDDPYRRLVSDFGTTVVSAKRLAANQSALTSQVDSSREQLSGVSLDEETVNMVSAQRAYEAAARVMTTVDSMLDTLINRTGLVR